MAKVIVEAPFRYTAEVIRRRGRVPHRVTLVATHPFAVPVVGPERAPVVIEAVCQRSVYRDMAWRHEAVPVPHRLIDGRRLVRPLTVIDRWEPGAPAFDPVDRGTADAALRLSHRLLLTYRDEALRPQRRVIGAEPEDERTIETRVWGADDRDAALARATRFLAEGAAFIDGVLHIPTKGPGWTCGMEDIEGEGLRRVAGMRVYRTAVADLDSGGSGEAVFAPGEEDAAEAEVERLHEIYLDLRGARGQRVERGDPQGAIRVLAAVPPLDLGHLRLAEAARLFLEFTGLWVNRLPPDLGQLHHDLCLRLDRYDIDGTLDGAAMEADIQRLRAVWAPIARQRGRYLYDGLAGYRWQWMPAPA